MVIQSWLYQLVEIYLHNGEAYHLYKQMADNTPDDIYIILLRTCLMFEGVTLQTTFASLLGYYTILFTECKGDLLMLFD